MLGIFDELELDVFEQTGSLECAQAVGHAARESIVALTRHHRLHAWSRCIFQCRGWCKAAVMTSAKGKR